MQILSTFSVRCSNGLVTAKYLQFIFLFSDIFVPSPSFPSTFMDILSENTAVFRGKSAHVACVA